ncbi:MAG: SUMF1/EgtB/PvdO family nonheme iron enzyme [Bryobacterales bacterium]|nr:SUMF1/EgtB/PvdO family nonheme iron enzyme [Bryobacterales bacterium]
MARSTLAGLIFALTVAAQSPQLKQAGVCSRCHVAQVLEWSVATKHVAAQTNCQSCHGKSDGHVVNERNQVKPDVPVPGCQTCHNQGCPKTKRTQDCQSCHHSHALSNPNDRQLRQTQTAADPRLEAYKISMAEGDRLAAIREWAKAQEAYQAALQARPADRRAAMRAKMTQRRRNPEQPGLEIIGTEFDEESGFPKHVRVKGIGIEMLLVPGGETDIGSEQWPASRPVHSVRTGPFYLSKTEITQRQWEWLGADNPSAVKGPQLPVHNVSWNDAQAWITTLNARSGAQFRLPTEVEWERAAQPAEAPLDEQAWYRANTAGGGGGFKEANAYTPRNTGTKRANALGFHDMQGNVAEWCQSIFRPYPFTDSPGGGELRSVRGGAYADSPEYLHPAFRHSERPSRRSPWIGLRLAR